MARTALPADHNIGVAVLHGDGSVSVGSGPRMRNSQATLEFPIGVLEIRGERVVWRPSSGVGAVFEYAGGKWFSVQDSVTLPPGRTEAPAPIAARPPGLPLRGGPKMRHAAWLLLGVPIVAWFVWDIATQDRGEVGVTDLVPQAEEAAEVEEDHGEESREETPVADDSSSVATDEPEAPPRKEVEKEGLGVIADELAVIVAYGDRDAWNELEQRLGRITQWLTWKDDELLRWQAFADRFGDSETELRTLAKEKQTAGEEFERVLGQLTSFDLRKLTPNERPRSRPTNFLEGFPDDQQVFRARQSATPPSVAQMGRFPDQVTRAQFRKLYNALVACQRSFANCALQERAFERLAELVPLEKLSEYPGQGNLSPPDGEIMAAFRYAGNSDWALPERNHPAMAQEYQVLENLNLSNEVFGSYFTTLLLLHPQADHTRYKERAGRYVQKPNRGPTRFDGSRLSPKEGMAENVNRQLNDFWWLDDDLDDESEFQQVSFLSPSDSRLAFGLMDDEVFVRQRLERQRELARSRASRGATGKKFTDDELREFERRFVQWQLVGWRYREKLLGNRQPASLEDELRALEGRLR